MLENKNGQALVEFVILLPIFIFMLFMAVDFGRILYNKTDLESKMDTVITDYQNSYSKEKIQERLKLENEEILLDVSNENSTTDFYLKKKITILTPGLNLILKNPYEIVVKRVIYNE